MDDQKTKKQKKHSNDSREKENPKKAAKEDLKRNFREHFHDWDKNDWKRCVVSKKISIFAVLLITVGVVALLQSFGIVQDAWGKLWPLFLIVPGAILLFRSAYKQ